MSREPCPPNCWLLLHRGVVNNRFVLRGVIDTRTLGYGDPMDSPLSLRLDPKTRQRIARIAVVDADDQYHEKCVDCLKTLRESLATVWPPLVEAMYLLGDLPKAQEAVWEMLARGVVQLMSLGLVDIP